LPALKIVRRPTGVKPGEQRPTGRRGQHLVALVVASVVAFAGCGGSTSAAPRSAAESYVAALYGHALTTACSSETPATQDAQRTTATLLTRYQADAYGPCSSLVLIGNGIPTGASPPTALRTTVDGDRATVTFPRDSTLPTVALTQIGGRWLVDLVGDYRGLQTAQQVEATLETNFYSPQCLTAWNDAVSAGQVTVQGLGPSVPSQAIWADLLGSNTDPAPCTSMEISKPNTGSCESYTQSQGDGSWSQSPCAGKPSTLDRNVWLDAKGQATPASQASPDGTMPALSDTASSDTAGTATSPNGSPSGTTGSPCHAVRARTGQQFSVSIVSGLATCAGASSLAQGAVDGKRRVGSFSCLAPVRGTVACVSGDQKVVIALTPTSG